MPPSRLTENSRATLEEARRGPLRRVHDAEHGKPPWPAHPSTLYSLVARGLLTTGERKSKKGHRVQEWTITDDGRVALEPVKLAARDVVRLLPVKGAATTRMMQFGVWVETRMPEPEQVEPQDLDTAWTDAALRRQAKARDKRAAAQRAASGRRAA